MKLIKKIESKNGSASIYKDDCEFITRLYNEKGEHLIDCDSFTDDKEDALITAETMLQNIQPARTNDFINETLIGRKIRFSAWDMKKGVVVKNIVRVVRDVGVADGLKYVVVVYKGLDDFRVTSEDIREVVVTEKDESFVSPMFGESGPYGRVIIKTVNSRAYFVEAFNSKDERVNDLCLCLSEKEAYAALDNEVDKLKAANMAVNDLLITFEGQSLKSIVSSNSGFSCFSDLVNAKGDYRPSIDCSQPKLKFLADQYDRYQETRGDKRRAFRYGSESIREERKAAEKRVKTRFTEKQAAATQPNPTRDDFRLSNGDVYENTGNPRNDRLILQKIGNAGFNPGPGLGKETQALRVAALLWLAMFTATATP